MKLVAIDPGSSAAAAAFFVDGRCIGTALARARGDPPWLERIGQIVAQLIGALDSVGALERPPDVIAIEDIALGIGHKANVRSFATMAMSRGYLMAELVRVAPSARILSVNVAEVRAAVSAPRGRAAAKRHFRIAVEALTNLKPGSQDEVDAVCVGLAALNKLRREALEEAT